MRVAVDDMDCLNGYRADTLCLQIRSHDGMSALAVLQADADLRLMMSNTSREMPGEFVPCWFLPLAELMIVWSEFDQSKV